MQLNKLNQFCCTSMKSTIPYFVTSEKKLDKINKTWLVFIRQKIWQINCIILVCSCFQCLWKTKITCFWLNCQFYGFQMYEYYIQMMTGFKGSGSQIEIFPAFLVTTRDLYKKCGIDKRVHNYKYSCAKDWKWKQEKTVVITVK